MPSITPPHSPTQLSLGQNFRKNAQREGAINPQSAFPPYRFPAPGHKLISQSPIRKGAKYRDLTISIGRKKIGKMSDNCRSHIKRVLRAKMPSYYSNLQRQITNSVRKNVPTQSVPSPEITYSHIRRVLRA